MVPELEYLFPQPSTRSVLTAELLARLKVCASGLMATVSGLAMVAALREGLPPALDGAALGQGKFAQTTEDLNIGVWGSDRVLDAWFGIPDPSQLDLIA